MKWSDTLFTVMTPFFHSSIAVLEKQVTQLIALLEKNDAVTIAFTIKHHRRHHITVN